MIDRVKLAEDFGFSIDDINKLIEAFVKNAYSSLEDMKKAIANLDMTSISSAAHSIKGISGNLKQNHIFELASDIEQHAKTNQDNDYTELYHKLKQEIDAINE